MSNICESPGYCIVATDRSAPSNYWSPGQDGHARCMGVQRSLTLRSHGAGRARWRGLQRITDSVRRQAHSFRRTRNSCVATCLGEPETPVGRCSVPRSRHYACAVSARACIRQRLRGALRCRGSYRSASGPALRSGRKVKFASRRRYRAPSGRQVPGTDGFQIAPSPRDRELMETPATTRLSAC